VNYGKEYDFYLQREYCALTSECGMKVPKQYCPTSKLDLREPLPSIKYKEERCPRVQSMLQAGVSHTDWVGKNVYKLLGTKYQIPFKLQNELPLPIEAFRYLLSDIPFAAKIVNAFRGTKYTVHYVSGSGKKYWKGNDGKQLQGEARLIAGSPQKDNLVYFGKGVVTIWSWKIHGPVLFSITYTANPNKPDRSILYELEILTFPGNGFMNSIMSLGFFERTVQRKIHRVFEDITTSSNTLNQVSYSELLKKHEWAKQDTIKLQHLKGLYPKI
jgi:hypothetical protein